jgi:hypothetical protein
MMTTAITAKPIRKAGLVNVDVSILLKFIILLEGTRMATRAAACT